MDDSPVIPAPDEMRALNPSAFAADGFEPFVGRMFDTDILDRVVASGWVESGQSCRPAVGNVGYRLTAKGWDTFYRLRAPRPASQ